MAEEFNWKLIFVEGLLLAFVLFLITYPFYGILTQDQLWPGPGQNSPEISAYQLSIFAQEAAEVIIVLALIAYAFIRKASVITTGITLVIAYVAFYFVRNLLYVSTDIIFASSLGEQLGGLIGLGFYALWKKWASPGSTPKIGRKPRK